MNLVLDIRWSVLRLHFGLRIRLNEWQWNRYRIQKSHLGKWRQWNPNFGPIEPNIFHQDYGKSARWLTGSISIDYTHKDNTTSLRLHPFPPYKKSSHHDDRWGRTTDSIWWGPFWFYKCIWQKKDK